MLHKQSEKTVSDPVPTAFVLTVVFLALSHALSTITTESFWTDELFTRYLTESRLPLSALWQRMLNEPHPPTYYLSLRAWTSFFGDSSFALRAFSWSAFCLFLLVPFTSLGREALGPRRNLFVLLSATSFLLMRFAQEARVYELLALFALLATFLNVVLLRHVLDNTRIGNGPSLAVYLVYPITALLHVYGFIYVGISLLYLAGTALLLRRRRQVFLIFAAGAFTLLLEVGWLLLSLPFLKTLTGGSHWITFEIIPRELASFLVKALSGNFLLGVVLAVALFKYGARALHSPEERMLVIIVILGIALPILASLHSPIVIDRFLIVYVPAVFFVLAGLCGQLWNVQPDSRRLWLSSLFGVGLAAAVLMQHITIKPDWEGTGRVIESFQSCANATIVAYPVHRSFAYPAVDADEKLFLHRYAAPRMAVNLAKINGPNLNAASSDRCPVFGWIVREQPAGVDRILKGSGFSLKDFDQYWSSEAVILFKRNVSASSAR